MSEPWDVPETAEGRETLIRLAEQFEAEGKLRELGVTLTRLSQFIMQIGTGREDAPAFDASISVAKRAVELLRQTDDRRSLAKALRQAGHPLASDREPLLLESLAISREIGDLEGEGWSYYSMSSPTSDPTLLDKARVCFERAGSKAGMACIDQRRGLRNRDWKLIVSSADLFAEVGRLRDAGRSLVMANVFGDDLTVDEREAILLRALDYARQGDSTSVQVGILETLVKLMGKAKRKDQKKRYSQELRELEKRQ